MSTNLQDLCESFCTLVNLKAPPVLPQHDGTVAFNIQWREVEIDLAAQPGNCPSHAFIIFHMGLPDPARADIVDVLQALLRTNFLGLHPNQPVFSCHPESRAPLLQWALPLADTDGDALLQVIGRGVDLVLRWREAYFLDSEIPAAAMAPASHVSFA